MENVSHDKRVFTVKETAAELRVHAETVYQAVRQGQIRAIHLGRKILVPAAELDRLLAAGA